MKRYIKSNKGIAPTVGKKRRAVKASEQGNNRTVVLKDMNTDVIPVADFGCYGGLLADALEDVFVADAVNTEVIDPNDEYYDEIMQLIAEGYDGTSEFYAQVLDYAPATIQAGFDDYDIAATVVDGSCKWNHPSYYNYSDDVIEFDMAIDTSWVESKFAEFSNDPGFQQFIDNAFSSRSGFISYMPNSTYEYSDLLDPNNSEYWKVVSAIIQYIVDSDKSIRESVTEDLYDDLRGNANYTTFSGYDIY